VSDLTETQLRNVEILRSQGDTDERIAENLRIPLDRVPTAATDPDADAGSPDPAPPGAPVPPAAPSPVTPDHTKKKS
jgi:hypothetical protein